MGPEIGLIVLVGLSLIVSAAAIGRFGAAAFDIDLALAQKRRTPSARAVAGEHMKLVGTVRCELGGTRAPITGRPCAAWTLVVSGAYGGDPLAVEDGATDFVLDDDSGTALVVGRGAAVSLRRLDRIAAGIGPHPNLGAVLDRARVEPGTRLLHEPMRWVETVLLDGDTTAVSARVELESDPDPAHATGMRETAVRPLLRATRQTPLLISDAPRALR